MQISDIYMSISIEFSVEMIFCDALGLRGFCRGSSSLRKTIRKIKISGKIEIKSFYYCKDYRNVDKLLLLITLSNKRMLDII